MRARLAWTLALAAACSFESEPAAFESFDNRCSEDADCLEGLCDGSICIDDTNVSVEVLIEVLSGSSETQRSVPTSWAFTAGRFEGPTMRDLVFPAVREVRGNVRWEGRRVPATLRFTRRMPSGTESPPAVPVEVDTLREPAADELGRSYDFAAVLVAGETYDVAIVPTSDMVMSPGNVTAPAVRSLPPLYDQVRIEAGDPLEPFRADISFPEGLDESCTQTRTSSCTLEATVVSFDGEVAQPEAGLQVRAVDKATGRVVSSIAETDGLGSFAIRLGEDADDYFIRVTSSAGRDPFPAVSVDPDLALNDEPLGNAIYVPRLQRIQFSGRVRDEAGTPVPSATVRFSSNGIFDGSQLGLQGSFSTSASTDEEGAFGAELLPGYYSVTVTPPEDADRLWGVLSADALVGPEVTVSEALIVPNRAELFGWVRTFGQEAAVGVTVLGRARTVEDRPPLQRSQEAVTNSLGRFTMQMDLGVYDLQIKVPSESGYAWLVEPTLSIEEDVARTYWLEPPVPIEGTVQAVDGTPVPGALIRAYALVDDGPANRYVQVGETTSDEEGGYRLLIAPGLDAE